MYSIYKITNKCNNMIYIGCTTKTIEKRFNGHKNAYKTKSNALYLAMREFGIENFCIELIETDMNDAIRYEREKYYIKKFDSMNASIGYNRTIGGTGTIGYVFTEADKKKISEAGIGKVLSKEHKLKISKIWKGKHLPKEVRNKISNARIGKYTGKENPFFGKHHSKEDNDKAVATKKERRLLRPVKGIIIKTGEEITFDSLSDASRYIQNIRGGVLSTLISHIGNSIVGRYSSKSAYGVIWTYIETSNDYPDKE